MSILYSLAIVWRYDRYRLGANEVFLTVLGSKQWFVEESDCNQIYSSLLLLYLQHVAIHKTAHLLKCIFFSQIFEAIKTMIFNSSKTAEYFEE